MILKTHVTCVKKPVQLVLKKLVLKKLVLKTRATCVKKNRVTLYP